MSITDQLARLGEVTAPATLLPTVLASVADDQYGLLGADRVPVNWLRILGIALLAAGAALTLKR